MSYRLQPILRSLLEGVSRSERPVFFEADLEAIDPAGLRLLLQERVLRSAGIPDAVEDTECGTATVHLHQKCRFLIDPENPGRDWTIADERSLRRCRFDHRAMLDWIARGNGMAGEASPSGPLWTVGTSIVGGLRCRILYYPGIGSRDALLLAVKDFRVTASDAKTVHLLLIPAAVALSNEDLAWIEEKGIFLEPLYRLAGDDGIDIGTARLPDYRPTLGYYFRRSASGWEVGYDTTMPRAVPKKSGMDAIWFLLRNPGEEFTAMAINDQLHLSESGVPRARSTGSRAKSIADLPPGVKKELSELRAEMARAKEKNDERTRRDADEEYKRILRDHGIKDSFAGMTARENDDQAKEAETLTRSIKRCLDSLEKTRELSELVDHLRANLEWGTRFIYGPPETPPWRTT